MYIVIEGQDATGKDTQAKLLVDFFLKQGKKVVYYAESGTGSEDDFIRKIAELTYGSKQNIDHQTRVLLYLVNRYHQWKKMAEPMLKDGGVVITTRNWFSTLIYEGYGAGVSKNTIIKLHKAMMPDRYFKPDKIVCLFLDDASRQKRLKTQANEADTAWQRKTEVWKSKGDDFQQKLNKAYLNVAKEYDIPLLSAAGSIEEVQENLRQIFKL